MKNNTELIRCSIRFFLSIFWLSAIPMAGKAQALPNFSGQWKQDNDRCQPKRHGLVTLHIEHHNPELTIESLVTHDGKASTSTGTDGDEFHTAVIWKDSTLVFSIEEHEDGRILRSKETWTLIER